MEQENYIQRQNILELNPENISGSKYDIWPSQTH